MSRLADLIDTAIHKRLWDGAPDYGEDIQEYSCMAVAVACRFDNRLKIDARHFLESLGCNPSERSNFNLFPAGQKRQYARALWLTWAAMIAREERV